VFAKPDTYQCSCSSAAITYQIVGAGDPDGQCHSDERVDFVCSGLGVSCTQWKLTSCGSATPTPTPTPCQGGGCGDPNAIPLDCTYYNPPFNDGCPLGYLPVGTCCYPKACPSPMPSPSPCDGTVHWMPAPTCQSMCIRSLPTDGTGGGQGQESGDMIEGCDNYYWVWFEWDGHQWTPTGEITFAGCY
jgi:hypothetical protein